MLTPTQQGRYALGPVLLQGVRRGIEKESLRVRRDGSLAITPHPAALGSPLTHSHITTDFSESQLELITGVHATIESCLEELARIHQVVYRHIGDEVLWCASMPCDLPSDDTIPIAQYGSSNVGRAKAVYRAGLAHRYGRRMQMISGIHYNFSLSEAAWSALQRDPNEAYFALIRNFRRESWLLLYLFGASPAVCRSFIEGRGHRLLALSDDTLYAPHATSLRMGPLGYQSEAQASLAVSYNDLESYAAALEQALTRPYGPYEAIGIREGDDYRQLATSLLQIENEFYGTIRPKRRIRRGERPLHALRERGVEYVEVRLIDLDPFSPIGITAEAIRFLDAFLLHCLLSDSGPDTPQEIEAIAYNQHSVAERGREPGLALVRGGSSVKLLDWGMEILDACQPVAEALDARGPDGHSGAITAALTALADPGSVPSSRMLDLIERRHGRSFRRFVLTQSLQHASALRNMQLSGEVESRYGYLAQKTLKKQCEMEASDVLPFETYRQQYLSPHSLKREALG
ncbi:MAG: glutamate--cysteine ligase [Burkholderiales bacterium]